MQERKKEKKSAWIERKSKNFVQQTISTRIYCVSCRALLKIQNTNFVGLFSSIRHGRKRFSLFFSKRMLIGCTQFNWDMFGLDLATKTHLPRWIWLHYFRNDANGKWQTTSIVKYYVFISTHTFIFSTYTFCLCKYTLNTVMSFSPNSNLTNIRFFYLIFTEKKGSENCQRKAKKKKQLFSALFAFSPPSLSLTAYVFRFEYFLGL